MPTWLAKANKHDIEAAVQQMKRNARGAGGDKWELAHHRTTSADSAWTWKVVRPEGPLLRLSDAEYAIAARLSLGLPPFPPQSMAMLPAACPLCSRRVNDTPVSLRADPWHWLTCAQMRNGELTRRHDAVVDAISRVARQVGAQVRTEVKGLDPNSEQRPDLKVVFPGRMLLTDVSISHTLTPSAVAAGRAQTSARLSGKNTKYAGVASRLGAELLNVVVDTGGGMTGAAMKLVDAVGEEGERWSAGTWSSAAITRHLLGAIAVAVQRGNALAMLCGYTRAAVPCLRAE